MSTSIGKSPFSSFGNILKQARWERGWSQADLADEIDTGVRTIQRWEQGLALPRPYNLRLLLTVLEKTPRELGLSYEPDNAPNVFKVLLKEEDEAKKVEVEQAEHSQETMERRLAQLEDRVHQLEDQLAQVLQAQQKVSVLEQHRIQQKEVPHLEVVPPLPPEVMSTEEQAVS